MKQKDLNIHYQLLDSADELPQDEQELLAAALEATHTAWAPFSEFFVGCAILLENGEIGIGNNQENRAYPSGLCAERVALFHLGAIGQAHMIQKIAIRARSKRKPIDKPVMPCGACRQVMVEYEHACQRPFVLLTQGASGKIVRLEGIQKNLLPLHFDVEF